MFLATSLMVLAVAPDSVWTTIIANNCLMSSRVSINAFSFGLSALNSSVIAFLSRILLHLTLRSNGFCAKYKIR